MTRCNMPDETPRNYKPAYTVDNPPPDIEAARDRVYELRVAVVTINSQLAYPQALIRDESVPDGDPEKIAALTKKARMTAAKGYKEIELMFVRKWLAERLGYDKAPADVMVAVEKLQARVWELEAVVRRQEAA